MQREVSGQSLPGEDGAEGYNNPHSGQQEAGGEEVWKLVR